MKKYLIVIPARSGSSFRGKNTYPCAGLPLIYHTVNAAQNLGHDVLISTDDHYIKAEAEQFGTMIDDRPEHLCTAEATLDSVMWHIHKQYRDYENFICLP